MLTLIRKRMKGEKGFTLIELLVVIIIIAILAAIAIPTFLGQRQKAQDAAAKSLIRNAMTSVESAYTDTQTFVGIDQAALKAIEPSIQWPAAAENAGAAGAPAATDLTKSNIVGYAMVSATSYELGTWSASGKEFGVVVDKTKGNTFWKSGAAVAAGASW